jgi:multidrug efflux system membrane fusion protein
MPLKPHVIVCIAALLASALPGCASPAHGAEKRPIPVKVEDCGKPLTPGAARYSGTLEPASRVDMAFRVGGYVESLGSVTTPSGKRALDKGDFVRKGSVLARVRATDYSQKVSAAKAQVSRARAELALAQAERARAEKLFEGKAIPKAELDFQIARAESAEAQVEGAIAHANEADLSLTDTVLRAPMDGVILARHVEVGKLVAPGEPAITVADTRSVKAVFGAPQLEVEKLVVGSPVQVYVGAESESKAPEKLLSAAITRIAPVADSNGRVFSIEASLPNEDGHLRPGTVVSFRLPGDTGKGASSVVPLRAVIRSPRDARSFAVFALEGGSDRGVARLREVELGEIVGNGVTVTRGLTGTERIVTLGSTLLFDGSDVIVVR